MFFKKKEDGIICTSRGATLVRVGGEVVCRCPFACMATHERCEFTGSCGHDHRDFLKKLFN